jgi:hypothetical protein
MINFVNFCEYHEQKFVKLIIPAQKAIFTMERAKN